jgi:hypothetical protein
MFSIATDLFDLERAAAYSSTPKWFKAETMIQ